MRTIYLGVREQALAARKFREEPENRRLAGRTQKVGANRSRDYVTLETYSREKT